MTIVSDTENNFMDTKDYDLRGLLWPDWLRDHWLSVGGSFVGITEPTVSQVLYSLVIANKPTKGIPHSPYSIVETGIRYGASACWLALAANAIDGGYLGIDTDPKLVKSLNALFEKHSLRQCALAVEGSSPERVLEIFNRVGEGCSIDLLFIDDDHSVEHITKEIEVLWPLIRPGGFMAFHDVIGNFPIWEIIKARGAMKLVYEPYNRMGQQPFGGLGIIRKPME